MFRTGQKKKTVGLVPLLVLVPRQELEMDFCVSEV